MDVKVYLPYLKSMIGRKIGWTISDEEDGIVRAGYPLYDKQLLNFMQEFHASAAYDQKYRQHLKAAHIKTRLNSATVQQVLATDDQALIRAMLSYIYDWESVEEGLWAKALQEGYLYQLAASLTTNNEGRI